VVKNKNGRPDSKQKDSTSQLQWRWLFLNGKQALSKTQTLSGGSYWVYTRNRDVLGLGETKGRPQLGLKARHDTKACSAQNRWRSTLSWTHRMIHESSGAGTRTKGSVSSSSFQCIWEHLIWKTYEGDITVWVQGFWLNPNRTRSPSWRRFVAWWWGRLQHVQHGDVLITDTSVLTADAPAW